MIFFKNFHCQNTCLNFFQQGISLRGVLNPEIPL